MSSNGVETILFRLRELENKVAALESQVGNHSVSFAEVRGELKNLRQEISSVKEDVLTAVFRLTDRTWKLIFVLVALVAALIGVKELPKIW